MLYAVHGNHVKCVKMLLGKQVNAVLVGKKSREHFKLSCWRRIHVVGSPSVCPWVPVTTGLPGEAAPSPPSSPHMKLLPFLLTSGVALDCTPVFSVRGVCTCKLCLVVYGVQLL